MKLNISLINGVPLLRVNGEKSSIQKGDFIIVYLDACITLSIYRPLKRVDFIDSNGKDQDKLYIGDYVSLKSKLELFLSFTGFQLEVVEETQDIVKLKVI